MKLPIILFFNQTKGIVVHGVGNASAELMKKNQMEELPLNGPETYGRLSERLEEPYYESETLSIIQDRPAEASETLSTIQDWPIEASERLPTEQDKTCYSYESLQSRQMDYRSNREDDFFQLARFPRPRKAFLTQKTAVLQRFTGKRCKKRLGNLENQQK